MAGSSGGSAVTAAVCRPPQPWPTESRPSTLGPALICSVVLDSFPLTLLLKRSGKLVISNGPEDVLPNDGGVGGKLMALAIVEARYVGIHYTIIVQTSRFLQ